MAKDASVQKGIDSVSSAIGVVYDEGFQDGVASVPQSPGGFSQEQVDTMVADAVAAAKADDQAKLDDMSLQLGKALSDDEADKKAIADKQSLIDQIKALLG